jgi:hypothetical protein
MGLAKTFELMAAILKKSLEDPLKESKIYNTQKEKKPQV